MDRLCEDVGGLHAWLALNMSKSHLHCEGIVNFTNKSSWENRLDADVAGKKCWEGTLGLVVGLDQG